MEQIASRLLKFPDSPVKGIEGEEYSGRSLARSGRLTVTGVLALVLAVLYLSTSGLMFLRLFEPLPQPARRVLTWLAPFRTINNYGLFAVMTTYRPEIIIEGSDDGETWRAYEFKWKPGDPGRLPRFVAPYQPRLDWQMWFAALGGYQGDPWFINLLARLREGSPEVLALLETNPFPDRPPRYVRAILYNYHFTQPGQADGAWWQRTLVGPYMPVVMGPGGGDQGPRTRDLVIQNLTKNRISAVGGPRLAVIPRRSYALHFTQNHYSRPAQPGTAGPAGGSGQRGPVSSGASGLCPGRRDPGGGCRR